MLPRSLGQRTVYAAQTMNPYDGARRSVESMLRMDNTHQPCRTSPMYARCVDNVRTYMQVRSGYVLYCTTERSPSALCNGTNIQMPIATMDDLRLCRDRSAGEDQYYALAVSNSLSAVGAETGNRQSRVINAGVIGQCSKAARRLDWRSTRAKAANRIENASAKEASEPAGYPTAIPDALGRAAPIPQAH